MPAVPAKVAHGKVTFVVRDVGHLKHEFVVIKTKRSAAKLPVKGARAVETGRVGKIKAFGFIIGQVMKATAGKADPARVHESVRRVLGESAGKQS